MSINRISLPGTGTGPLVEVDPGIAGEYGNLVAFTRLVPVPTDPVPASAVVVVDDVRILTSGWRPPQRLPVHGGDPRPVTRLQVTFTPDHFAATVEYASRDQTPDPATWTGDPPTLTDKTLTLPSVPTGPGGLLLLLLTPDVDTDDSTPSFGHQSPSTASGFKWLARTPQTLTLDGFTRLDSNGPLAIDGGQFTYLTIYATDVTGPTRWPNDTAMPIWSYPTTLITWRT